ncbi:MAG: SDR family NAD(P)-dependent oxidoreductase [Sulfurimonas sp.]|nr:SDR family NAD(P)-dependent oxidoreductase [Sulfurimonas sp.]
MAILITGGAGYIGSHTLIELAKENHDFIVYDNLLNASQESLKRVSEIIGRDITFIEGDIRDTEKLKEVFSSFSIDSVIHFAGLKAVGESVSKPLEYYDNNVVGTLRLLEVMQEFDCKKIVFSSSATVYGEVSLKNHQQFADFNTERDLLSSDCDSNDEVLKHKSQRIQHLGITENFPVSGTTNPYGTSKYMIERILEDLQFSDNSFKIAILRYFNPVGAHESGTIGEDPNGVPNNLMPFIAQTAVGKREYLSVFGSDYDTHDGTGVRDYIHVVDLANAHVKEIDYLNALSTHHEPLITNIGTGIGYSVLDVVKAFEKASGKEVPYKLVERRTGDIAKCYANPSYAKEVLGWEAKKTIEEMCIDSWRWQSNNPNGYNSIGDDK